MMILVNLLGGNINIMNTGAMLDTVQELGLEENVRTAKYVCLSPHRIAV
jgi:hypothetical protein